ncbi:nucleotidyltransferase family protein [Phycicoccus flavus]|uniref:Nucleotidyltransferase family protein n=1 Tax=Phycicoccus flavus TaxID=2502783 RepID=A0A8T6R5C7_9MICO|nr:nucleotidyltransferase family protein [Phycicoccus flavus]NHA68793.1 nucleotidyltransferase family protein [Phycicoccus flavus]
MSEAVTEGQLVPLRVRVELAHAAVQRLAESCGVDLLHVKGPAVDPGLRGHDGRGTDADVLVRPAHVRRFLAALHAHGWRTETTFGAGSAFDHAANLYHSSWGLLDVHRLFPGMDRDPAAAFEVLWAERVCRDLGHVPCPVPSPLGQSLLLLLHAARTRTGGVHPDVGPNWTLRTEDERRHLRTLAERTGATVGLAAATGELGVHAGSREAALWEVFAGDDDRLGEWRARWRSARGPAAKASVAVRSLGVNRYYLRQRLGREPRGADVALAFVHRLGTGTRALVVRGARRVRR